MLHNQQISYSYRSNQDGNNDNNQQQPIVLKSEKPSLMIEKPNLKIEKPNLKIEKPDRQYILSRIR